MSRHKQQGTTDRVEKEDRRTKRVPLGQRKQSMTVNSSLVPPNKVGRWVNDIGGRLQDALDAGYTFVTTKKRDVSDKVGDGLDNENTAIDSRVSKIVDKTARLNSHPVRAYLMAIDRDLYEEDQKEKLKRVEKVDRQIMGGGHGIKDDRDKFNANIQYSY